jgi:hypothetical protein
MRSKEYKLTKSESVLLKNYCSRVSDEELFILASSLPQSVIGDRSLACDILQKDKEIDRWLMLAPSADDWFSKIDNIGEFAVLEIQSRTNKSE